MNCLCTFWNKINSYTGWINFVFYSKVCLHMYMYGSTLFIFCWHLQAAVCIFLHHAVLLICYWCNMEFTGLNCIDWSIIVHELYVYLLSAYVVEPLEFIAAKCIPHIRLIWCVLLLTVEELARLYYCIGSEHAANFLYDLSRLS